MKPEKRNKLLNALQPNKSDYLGYFAKKKKVKTKKIMYGAKINEDFIW